VPGTELLVVESPKCGLLLQSEPGLPESGGKKHQKFVFPRVFWNEFGVKMLLPPLLLLHLCLFRASC